MKKKVTSTDVARLAGVSQSTVSMILNRKEGGSFSEETIVRVEKAASQLKYKFKSSKNQLLRSVENSIMVFCPSLSNPYYNILLQAIEDVLLHQGYKAIFCNTLRVEELEQQYLNIAISSHFTGVIYTYFPRFTDITQQAIDNLPTVFIGDRDASTNADAIELDSYKSGSVMAEHLVALGHKKIAYITTPLKDNLYARNRRLAGFKETILASGICEPVVVAPPESGFQATRHPLGIEFEIGYQLTKELLDKKTDVTAFAGISDNVALGCLDALVNSGFKVPKDYSVIGCDNIGYARLSGVNLTTVEHFTREKGKQAVLLLLERIREKEFLDKGLVYPSSITRVEYKPKLVVGGTTGRRKTN